MKKEVFSVEFIKYSNSDKAQQIRSDMVKAVIENKGFTLLEFQNTIAFGKDFVSFVLPLYRDTHNQIYILK